MDLQLRAKLMPHLGEGNAESGELSLRRAGHRAGGGAPSEFEKWGTVKLTVPAVVQP
jgi:hypothetical protein